MGETKQIEGKKEHSMVERDSKKTEIFVDPREFDEHVREKVKESYKHGKGKLEVGAILKDIHKKTK
jgi:ERCC4-type nuclease